MSKLIDRLRRIMAGEPHRMGFSSAQGMASKASPLAMLVTVPGPDPEFVNVASQARADAIIIRMDGLAGDMGKLEEALRAAGDAPCGVTLENALPEDTSKLASMGADFVALHTETAPAALLRSEGIGRVVMIDPYLDESLLRSIDHLAIDAVIIELEQGNEEFLTVREIMACRRAVDLVRKPVILRISNKLSADDLANIRDLGIESVLVDLSVSSPDTALTRLRQNIDELPPRRRQREGMEAILPKQAPVAPHEPEDDEL